MLNLLTKYLKVFKLQDDNTKNFLILLEYCESQEKS